jgi:hypothetical protein
LEDVKMAESIVYGSQVQQVGTITVAAGGTAETITLGWVPRYVKAISEENLTIYEHFTGMTADTSIDTFNHADTQIAINAAGGITLVADTADGRGGFTLGVDICDTTSDTVHWVAIR